MKRVESWQPLVRIANHLLLTYFMQISFSSPRGKKIFSVLFITDLNTASLAERSLTAAISHIWSTSVMLECSQNLSKLTNQRAIQILVYPERRFEKFAHRRSFASSRRVFFFRALFSALAPSNKWTPGRGYSIAPFTNFIVKHLSKNKMCQQLYWYLKLDELAANRLFITPIE